MPEAIEGDANKRAGQAAWIALGVIVTASMAVILWETRGTTYFLDEVNFFQSIQGFDPRYLLAPLGGQLVAVPRAVYALSFELSGTAYFPFRLLQAIGIGLVGVIFFALSSRRVGPIALAPAAILLFFGSSYDITVSPVGLPIVWAIAFGLGALLALDGKGGRRDALACLLLLLSAFSHTVGLPFVVAAAVLILLDPEHLRRTWVFLVPLGAYGAWWLAKPTLETSLEGVKASPDLGNLLGAPDFIANAAAAVSAALFGLNLDTAQAIIPHNTDPIWGWFAATLLVGLLVWRFTKGGIEPQLWSSLALLGSLWLAYALVASSIRTPETGRYLFSGAVAVLLVATEAARHVRWSRPLVAVVCVAAGVSVAVNIAHVRQGGKWLRAYSDDARAQFTALELLPRIDANQDYRPTGGVFAFTAVDPDSYRSAIDRVGPLGFSVPELEAQPEDVRASVDRALAEASGVSVRPGRHAPGSSSCRSLRPDDDTGVVPIDDIGGGLALRSPTRAQVLAGRFASIPATPIGTLSPNRWSTVSVPTDDLPGSWDVAVTPVADAVTAC